MSQDLLKLVASKVLSGRFILAILSGFVFAYSAYARVIPAEAIVTIIVVVFRDYFYRSDRGKAE